MQIFLTSEDFKQCAIDLDDVRLNCQIKECCQILSTALWINDCGIAETLYSGGKIYLPTHENHPIVKWCSESIGNYIQTVNYLDKCLEEYKYRFNKKHSCDKYWRILFYHSSILNNGPYDDGINCTTHHKHIYNIYQAYKLCLTDKWNNDKIPPKWTRRSSPIWYKEKD